MNVQFRSLPRKRLHIIHYTNNYFPAILNSCQLLVQGPLFALQTDQLLQMFLSKTSLSSFSGTHWSLPQDGKQFLRAIGQNLRVHTALPHVTPSFCSTPTTEWSQNTWVGKKKPFVFLIIELGKCKCLNTEIT